MRHGRRFAPTFLAAACFFLVSYAVPASSELETSANAPDSGRASWGQRTTEVRATYQNAWAHRQAGDFTEAVRLSEQALDELEEDLGRDPDMATRRKLIELKARLVGLRQAARHDMAEAKTARASGNEPDSKVLNAPAAEDIEPQINPDVLRWIEHFTDRGRSTFERYMRRSGRYMDLFRKVLQKEGLPPDLVHLVFVESGFNVNAHSSAAAVGPWQFLRSTGRLFGLTVNQWTDERKDPEKSTVAAARYLKHLYSIFGDWPLALASYNAGEGTVLRAIKRQGTTNYWDLRLPAETENYVPQFMAVLTIARDPERYGFKEVELDEPMAFDEIAFKGAVDLRALARLADCDVKELKELNPAVLSHAARGRDDVTTLRVPRGKGERLIERLQDGASLPAVDLTLKHRVRRGETLQGIANKYHVSATKLALHNGIGRKRPLKRGMKITVPVSSAAPVAVKLDAGDPRASTAYVPPRSVYPRTSLGAKSEAVGRMTIKVARGQTLRSIAETYGVTVEDLKRWNHLKSSRVRPGTRLKIRTPEIADGSKGEKNYQLAAKRRESEKKNAQIAGRQEETKSSSRVKAKKAKKRNVVVKRGDTLSSIARRHGISAKELQRANKLPSHRIRAGQRLMLPNV